jgi:hypothetical protein
MTQTYKIENEKDLIDIIKNKKITKKNKIIYNCKQCGKEEIHSLKYIKSLYKQNKMFLCKNCMTKQTRIIKYGSLEKYSQRIANNLIQTNQQKYGVNATSQLKDVKEKQQKTNLQNYGFVTPLLNDNIKQKTQSTLKEKYGENVINIWQAEEIKEKCKQIKKEKYDDENFNNIKKCKETNLQRYGVVCTLQEEKTKEKAKKTIKEKYGVDHIMQSKEIQDKVQKTLKEKYGGKLEKITEKIQQTMLNRYGVKSPIHIPEIRKKILGNKGPSKPEKKLYELLKNRKFNFQTEYLLNNHHFDFAVFDNENNLKVLIDIDGTYFHGLQSDYDGKHVQGYNDCKRFLKVPENVKFIVCDEHNIEECINELFNVFNVSYNKWLKNIFNSLPKDFPYITYTKKRLFNDYNKLIIFDSKAYYNRYLSLSSILQFHKSIWDCHVKNKPSPYEAWNNKKLLIKCIKNRFIYKSNLSTQNILNGFSVCKLAPRISLFSPSLAKYLINLYLNEYDTIFDPFSGYSGRMLGACSLGKKYIGQDINEITINESKQIINFHNLNAELKVQNILSDKKSKYDCLFTCPPYGDKENWNQKIENKSCDEWIDVCLQNYKCEKYLFVVDKTEKYQKNIIQELRINSHLNIIKEYVILI